MYSWLVSFLEENNYSVFAVPIKWSRTTITQNAKDFIEYFEIHKSKHNYVLGFSYGAVIALLTAKKTNPDKMYLCSLSPDFSEDSNFLSGDIQKYIGKKRFIDTRNRSGRTLAKELKTETVIFYGENEATEFPMLKKRSEETAKLAVNAKLVIVPHSPHKIDFPDYINAIKLELLE